MSSTALPAPPAASPAAPPAAAAAPSSPASFPPSSPSAAAAATAASAATGKSTTGKSTTGKRAAGKRAAGKRAAVADAGDKSKGALVAKSKRRKKASENDASLALVVSRGKERFATPVWGVSECLQKLVNTCADQGLRLMVAPFSPQENKMMPPRAVREDDTPMTAGLLHGGTNLYVQEVKA